MSASASPCAGACARRAWASRWLPPPALPWVPLAPTAHVPHEFLQTPGLFGCATPIAVLYDQLMTGTGARPCAPIGLLRAFLLSDDAKLLNRGTDRGVAELVLQAIHFARLGRSITKLEMSDEGVKHYRAVQADRVAKIAAIFALPDATK